MSDYTLNKNQNIDSDSRIKQAVKETKEAWQKKMKGVWERRRIIYKNYWLKKLGQ
jgi:hypothetical protein